MLYRQPGSKYYWTKFNWQGKTYRKTTGATVKRDARTIESTIRSELAKGNFGILEPKLAPTLGEFLKKNFKPFTLSRFKGVPKSKDYYLFGIEALLSSGMASLRLDEITNQEATLMADRQTRQDGKTKLSPSTVNCVLRTLRRALKLSESDSGYPVCCAGRQGGMEVRP